MATPVSSPHPFPAAAADSCEPAVARLLAALESPDIAVRDPDWRVRRDVVLALGRYAAPAAFPALVSALDDADHRVVRDALGSLAALRAAYTKRYEALTGHPSSEVRLTLARVLGETKDVRAQPALGVLQKDPDDVVRAAAHAALALLNDAGEVWP